MNKIRYLIIRFDKPLMAWQLPYFRAAVIESTGRKSDLFHNHRDNKAVIYRYPLIQYKIVDKKPAIVCINAGTDDIHYLLENRTFAFNIKGRKTDYEIEELTLKYHPLQVWDKPFRYNLHHYMPFNQENYEVYKKLGTEKKRLRFTEELLQKHIELVVHELGCEGPHLPQVSIEQIRSEKFIEYKGVFHLTYCLNIRTNVHLPNYLGIGKAVSTGFGLVKALGDN